MAEKSGPDETPVALRQRIAQSRALVVRDLGGLHYELNFPLKFRKLFQRHTVVLVGAALAVGLLIALLRARPQKIYLSAAGNKVSGPNKGVLASGVLLGALKMAVTLVQPMVLRYLAKKGLWSDWKNDRSQRRQSW